MAVSQKKIIYLKAGSLLYVYVYVHGFVHRNIELSNYSQLFVISLGAENVTNFKKFEIVVQKPIFEVLYFLNNALKHISCIDLKIWAEMVPEILKSNNLKIP